MEDDRVWALSVGVVLAEPFLIVFIQKILCDTGYLDPGLVLVTLLCICPNRKLFKY